MSEGGSAGGRGWPGHLRRFGPAAVLLLGLGGFFAAGLHDYFSFALLRDHRDALLGLVERRPVLAGLGYFAAYALVTAFSLPVASLVTLLGGFLFGPWLGTAIVVPAATAGAAAVFLAARTAIGGSLRRRAGPFVARLQQGFERDGLAYLLVLRLIPLFPFWLVNVVPAILNMRLAPYLLGTFAGIVPGTFVYVSLGDGLGALIEAGQAPDLSVIFAPRILTPIIGLAVLALLPVLYRRWRARR